MKTLNRARDIYRVPSLPIVRGPVFFPRLTGPQESWFALYVQVKHEKEVAKRLEMKSVTCFLPLVESWSKRQDRRKKIHLPLFPGYVFVHAVLDNYTSVNVLKTPGALTLIRNSEGPLPIPSFQIENLKTLLDSRLPLNPHSFLREGDWVRVIRGPLHRHTDPPVSQKRKACGQCEHHSAGCQRGTGCRGRRIHPSPVFEHCAILMPDRSFRRIRRGSQAVPECHRLARDVCRPEKRCTVTEASLSNPSTCWGTTT